MKTKTVYLDLFFGALLPYADTEMYKCKVTNCKMQPDIKKITSNYLLGNVNDNRVKSKNKYVSPN